MPFDPDAYLAEKTATQNALVEPSSVDEAELSQFNPDAYLTSKEAAEYDLNQKQFGSPTQQALAGLEGLVRGGSLGTSDLFESRVLGGFSPELFSKEAIAGRQKANPLTSGIGNVLGSMGLVAGTGGLAAPAEAALAAKGVGPIAASALGNALEAGTFGIGNVISDASLGDPNLNAQKIISEVGMSGLFGGALGGLFKGIEAAPALLRSSKAQNALNEVGLGKQIPLTPVEEAASYGAPGGGNFRQSLPIDALEEGDQKPILEGLRTLKPNADEIIQAGQELGAATPEGMLTTSDHVKRLDYALTQSPSAHGIARNQLYNKAYQNASDTISKALGEGTTESLAQVGNKAKDILSSQFEAKYAPIKNLYEQIETLTPNIPFSEEMRKELGQKMTNMIEDESLIKGTPEHSFVDTFAKGIDQVDNLEKLKNFRTALGRATGPETRYVSGLIKNELDQAENKAIKGFADQISDSTLKSQANSLIDQIGQAKKAYSSFRDEMGRVGKLLWGGKKIYGAEDFLDKIEAETPEKFAKRLFVKDNSEALKWMNDNFPEVIQNLSQFEKAKIRDQSFVKGEFSPVKAISNIEKLQPETRDILFNPNEMRKFAAGKTYFDNFLPNFNPSGTAGQIQYHEYLKDPKAALWNWVKDIGIGKYIKHEVKLTPEQIEAAKLQADQAIKLKGISGILKRTGDQITDSAIDIFKSPLTKSALSSAVAHLSDKEYDKRVEHIKEFQKNPQKVMDHIAENTSALHAAAPQITQSLQNSLMKGLQFLSSKLPSSQGTFFLSPEWQPTPSQKVTFNRYYDAVNQPIETLKLLRNGLLTSEHLEGLETVHPDLLQEMRQKVISNLDPEKAQKMTYAQKYNLSQFLRQPLDENMTPQAIRSNQASMSAPQLSNQNAAGTGMRSRSTLGGLKELNLADLSATQTQKEKEE